MTAKCLGKTVTRRVFLDQTARTGAAIGLLGSPLAAGRARAETPRRGGILKLGLDDGSATDTLNPAKLVGSCSVNLSRQVYNTLVEIGDDGKAQPELAIGWEPRTGNREWAITLRPGVEFHNGKTLDAHDVVYSLNLHMGEQSQSGAKGIMKDVETVTAVNAQTVLATLKTPNADFPYLLSDFHLAIVPHGFSDFGQAIGTGGYRLTEFVPGIRAATERFANYWRSDRAHVDSVETIVINDDTARLTALRTGGIHIMNQLDPKMAGLLERVPDVQLWVTEGRQHYTLPMDGRVPPFDDLNVRLALKYAIDRNAIVDKLLRGYGVAGNDHPIARSDPFYNSELPQRGYDPDRARSHLKKAGYEELGVALHASTAAFPGAVDMAVLYREQAQQAGITITPRQAPADGYWKDVWMAKPWCASFWTGRPMADMMLSTVYKSDAPWNESRWTNERFDKLLLEARSLTDFDKRKELYWEMQRLIHDQCPTVIPVFASYIDAARAEIQGFVPNPNHMLSDHRIAERVWFA